MKSLYAYFGLLDLHTIDSPGHSLYQIGLVDSLRESFREEKFDFYSYYPEEVIKSAELQGFPSTDLGKLFNKYRIKLFDSPIHNIDNLLNKIKNKEYSKLYLKARFRNLSTLSKKWKDAKEFDQIIECAISSNYSKEEIVILDTDLSLSDKFIDQVKDFVTILIPSVDFPGISNTFLADCVNLHLSKSKNGISSVFYGNIDTSNYKNGNQKGQILINVLNWVNQNHWSKDEKFYIISKKNDFDSFLNKNLSAQHIDRKDRLEIWRILESSRIMINITKEKYNSVRFIPARIFEAMIFGMIPISYKFDFLCSAFSFNNIDDLSEIYAYLSECDTNSLDQAYSYFINSYLNILPKTI